jgi:hypothetical protein
MAVRKWRLHTNGPVFMGFVPLCTGGGAAMKTPSPENVCGKALQSLFAGKRRNEQI